MDGAAQLRERESFEEINYSIRPAKAAQRHMMAEVIGRLGIFAPLSSYQYVGFGSTFFVDFRMLHQRFGFKPMFSIERATSKRSRFEFNRPLRCVRMLFGESERMLIDPAIRWDRDPAVVWLDYDEPLNMPKFGDCDRVLTRARHGSLLVVSFSEQSGKREGRRARVKEWLDGWLDEQAYSDDRLDPRTFGELGLDSLTENACDTLRNAGGSKVFQQLFRFRYSDGHPMVTWGGLILDAERIAEAEACEFPKLPFVVREGGDTYEILLPNLTPAERLLAERYLPNNPAKAKAVLGRHQIPPEESIRLEKLYRYAPRFVETFA